MKQRILLIFMWVMFPLCLTAQGNFPLVQIQFSDLLQYQAQKIKRTIPSSFLVSMGFSRFEQNWLLVQRILASFGDGMLGLIQILTRFNNLFIDFLRRRMILV